MTIEIHTNHDGSIALDVIIEKNHGYELWEIVQAIENYTISRCALVAEGFNAAMNSAAMERFQNPEIADAVIRRDIYIGEAIRKLVQQNVDDGPDPEDYCAGCRMLNCRCDQPHQYIPNEDGFCTWCGLDELNPVEAHHDRGAWSSGNPVHSVEHEEPVTTHPNNDKGHSLRIEGDEYICSDCGKRWGFDDTDVPECD